MNLAIEYLLRNKRAHGLFSVPCSLFLTTASGHKLVVTINNYYGDCNFVMVKHWKTWLSKQDDKLPPFSDYKVSRDEVFCSPYTVLENCSILQYVEEPYPAGGKQYADHPQAATQDREYADYMKSFCNSEAHKARKLNWLWESFEATHVPEDLRFRYSQGQSTGMELQREIIQFYSKPLWYTWQYWKKHMLDFNNFAATELVFRREYVKHEKPSEPERTLYTSSSFAFQPTFWGVTTSAVSPYTSSPQYMQYATGVSTAAYTVGTAGVVPPQQYVGVSSAPQYASSSVLVENI